MELASRRELAGDQQPCRCDSWKARCASSPPQSQPLSLIPIALTHPEVVEALGQAEMLRRDVCFEVLVETWLQWDEFGQRWEVVHFLCGGDTVQAITRTSLLASLLDPIGPICPRMAAYIDPIGPICPSRAAYRAIYSWPCALAALLSPPNCLYFLNLPR